MPQRGTPDLLFAPLAQGLAQLEWTRWDIETHLRTRLPSQLSASVRSLSIELKRAFPAAAAPNAGQILRHLKGSQSTTPLLRFFRQTGAYPEMPTDPARFRPVAALSELALPALSTSDDLAEWLALSVAELTRFSDCLALSARTENAFAPHYQHHFVPKRDGSLRLIEEPKPFLKHLQRRILRGILAHVPPHPDAFGFRAGRSCLQAAARHAGEEMVIGFDLRGFFPSIHQHRIYGLYRSFGYPSGVARHLTGLTTAITPHRILAAEGLAHRDHLTGRHLPQGAPTSPALANLVAFNLDMRLAGLARTLNANYTRYADDMTFSGDRRIARTIERMVPRIVQDCGFDLNAAKTRTRPSHQRQKVTGLVVNRHLNLPRADYDHLKAVIHHLRKPTDPRRADRAFLERIDGRVAWLEQVNPAKGAKLRERLAEALQTGTNR